MLPRTLEPEVMDDIDEVAEYDVMDHAAVNTAFVDNLLAFATPGNDVLDVGTGTALIPIELCQRCPRIRVMATDSSGAMLDRANFRIESASLRDRVQPAQADAKSLGFEDAFFDCVLSNSLIHHLADPTPALADWWRMLRPTGVLFVRDLLRPESNDRVEQIVAAVAAGETDFSQQLLRQSLHAALALDEVRSMCQQVGIDPSAAVQTSDRHWTLAIRKPAAAEGPTNDQPKM